MKAIKSLLEIWCRVFQARQVMDALVHNSFISDCVCPRGFFHSLLHFPPCPPPQPPLSLSMYIYSIYIHIFSSPSLSSPSHSLSSQSVPSYEIKHESIIHSFKRIYHHCVLHCARYLQSFFLLCFSYSPLVWSHLKTPQHWGECILAVPALTRVVRRGSKNPFRGFSCHNNSSACLK